MCENTDLCFLEKSSRTKKKARSSMDTTKPAAMRITAANNRYMAFTPSTMHRTTMTAMTAMASILLHLPMSLQGMSLIYYTMISEKYQAAHYPNASAMISLSSDLAAVKRSSCLRSSSARAMQSAVLLPRKYFSSRRLSARYLTASSPVLRNMP